MLTAGQSIGNYKILQKIGTGGMGAVYLAQHPLIGKRAAIKVIHRELANNRDVVQRFFQEARAVNQIGNEHIVEIHDFGQTPEGDHFYVMEWLDGKTLASVMAQERVIPVMRALHVGAQIASALGAAHANGVIHRDLKPDNVMLIAKLGDPDFVKVLDFGLAKVFQSASAVQTAAGVLLGTPQYMSPEACESRGAIDHRTDIYALGILLFQMMTGKLPFDGETMGEVLVKQVTGLPPAPRGLNASIPPSVEQIVLRCLAKPADARFQTMMSLREALLSPDAYLGSAPPIQAARSVAPGEMGFDARTVMAHAAAQAAAAQAAQQRTTIGQMMPPVQRIHAASARMSAQQPTVMAGQAPMIGSGSIPVPGMMPPNTPKMNTMRIATPLGYSSHPPKRVWPIVLVLGLILGLGGGAFAVAWFGKKKIPPPRAGSSSSTTIYPPDGSTGSVNAPGSGSSAAGGSAMSAGSGSDAPKQPPDAAVDAAPPPKRANIAFESIPKGARVFIGDQEIGKTPFDIEFDLTPKAVTFEFRFPGYKKKTKTMPVTSSTSISVELEKNVPSHTNNGPRGSSSGLMRPGD